MPEQASAGALPVPVRVVQVTRHRTGPRVLRGRSCRSPRRTAARGRSRWPPGHRRPARCPRPRADWNCEPSRSTASAQVAAFRSPLLPSAPRQSRRVASQYGSATRADSRLSNLIPAAAYMSMHEVSGLTGRELQLAVRHVTGAGGTRCPPCRRSSLGDRRRVVHEERRVVEAGDRVLRREALLGADDGGEDRGHPRAAEEHDPLDTLAAEGHARLVEALQQGAGVGRVHPGHLGLDVDVLEQGQREVLDRLAVDRESEATTPTLLPSKKSCSSSTLT